jgi:WD40 repeat protein
MLRFRTRNSNWLLAFSLVVAFIGLFCFISLRREKGPAPEITQQPRADEYGDPLPTGALARLGTLRWRHGSYISRVAFSPDGKTLASGSPDGQVLLWQVATGKQIRRLKGHGGSISAVVFSPDGTMVASSSGG